MAIYVCNFWTLAIGTNAADDGVDREELGALLMPWSDSDSVVSIGFEVAGSSRWYNSTVSAKFSLSGAATQL